MVPGIPSGLPKITFGAPRALLDLLKIYSRNPGSIWISQCIPLCSQCAFRFPESSKHRQTFIINVCSRSTKLPNATNLKRKNERNDRLLSVSDSRGPVFRRHPLNGRIDRDETWAQGVSARCLIFRNIPTLITKNPNSWVLVIGSMLSVEPALFRESGSRAKITNASRDFGCVP